jgi:hypothetical protein
MGYFTRELVLAVVVVLCGLGQAAAPVPHQLQEEAEKRAVAAVQELGGVVTRDGKRPGKPVVEATFAGPQVTDAGLKELAPLTQLTTLNLSGTQVTDAGLKDLAPLTQLTTLDLSYTAVTDAGLKELSGPFHK